MPSNILSADTSFPNLTDEQTTDQKFKVITDYLYMLREQLRYSMANLGLENFNDASFQEISGLITEPVYAQLGDVDDKMASLVLDNEKLAVRMTDAEGNISSLTQTSEYFNTRLTDAEGNISSLTQTSETFRTQIQDLNGQMTSVTQSVNGIQTQIVGLDGSVTTITQTLNGLTVEDSGGTTLIRGDRIETGSLVLTGTITWDDLASDAKGEINGAYDAAETAQAAADSASGLAQAANDTVSGWTYAGSTYIDGSKLMTGTVTASKIKGGEVQLLADDDVTAGILGITGAQTSALAINLTSLGALRFRATDGDLYLSRDGGNFPTYIHLQDGMIIMGVDSSSAQYAYMQPNRDDVFCLGSPAAAWKSLYLNSPIISSSDRRRKSGIDYGLERYDRLFDGLKPASFILNGHEGEGRHLGLVAQDVEQALLDAGLERGDLAALVYEQDVYALRYEEFIPLLIRRVQRLDERVKTLEGA